MGNKEILANKIVSIVSWCLLLISALLFRMFNQELFIFTFGLTGVVLVSHFILVIRALYKKDQDDECKKKDFKGIKDVFIQIFLYILLLDAYIVLYVLKA